MLANIERHTDTTNPGTRKNASCDTCLPLTSCDESKNVASRAEITFPIAPNIS